MTVKTTNGKTETKLWAPRHLDIACGQNKQKGYKGIDIEGDADILWDLNETPWPIKTSSVHKVFCAHYAEHIPHHRPGWDRDGWWIFFDELHRIMRKDAQAEFLCPYVMNGRAFWDPTHVRFIHETTWYYLDKNWREMNGLDHYRVSCDFEVITVDATGVSNDFMARNHEQQAYARTHYWNVLADLRVLLKARK